MVNKAYQSIIEDMYRETVNELMVEIREEIKATDVMEEESRQTVIKNMVSDAMMNVARYRTEDSKTIRDVIDEMFEN
eukprot:4919184-Pleurochrysis_carterae.AAC.1